MFFRTFLLLACLSAPALAQSDGGVEPDAGAVDAGEADAGTVSTDAGAADTDAGTVSTDAGAADACDPSCEGDTLHFCDATAPATLECSSLDARCGELSPAWGADCLLPAGAACDPGYGFGESRCDRAASLYCVDGTCQVASGPEDEGPLSPSAGTHTSTSSSGSSDLFGCSSCGSSSAVGLLFMGGALRRLRRTRRS